MIDEFWVVFDGLPNYAVSNYGTILNIKKDKELEPWTDEDGYLRVTLRHAGKKYEAFVHRLVAKAFFLNYRDGIEVRHINGDKTENTVLNLTLGSPKE